MKVLAALAALFLVTSATQVAEAQVHVRGYTRSDGTYVRPHIRSTPDGTRTNNYGPSRSSPSYSNALNDLSSVSPYTRDHDYGGLANLYDRDDDNDGIGDDSDRTQYGSSFWQSPGARKR